MRIISNSGACLVNGSGLSTRRDFLSFSTAPSNPKLLIMVSFALVALDPQRHDMTLT